MKVVDVMSKQIDSIPADKSVREAAILIFGRGVNGLPVVKHKKLVGFITERDILANFYPTMREYMDDPVHSRDFEGMETTVEEIFDLTVEQIMSKNPSTIESDAPLLRAHSLMNIRKIGRLPVVDKSGNLIGMITKGDIFNALVGDKLIFTENEDYNDWLSKTYYAAVDWESRLKYEIPDMIKAFDRKKVEKIIDIGCGTGEHAIEFAKKGYFSVGIDRGTSMIEEANARKAKLPKNIQDKVNFYRDDVNTYFRKHKETFDAALFMGNTISHNPHVYKDVLKEASEHLSKTGVLILQITNFEKVLKKQNRLLCFNFAKLGDGVQREYAFLEFYDLPNKRDHTILKTFAILRSDGKRWKPVGVRNSLMAYTDKDIIKEVLEKIGFKEISFYGGFFDGRKWDYLLREPFKPLESDWLNVIARR